MKTIDDLPELPFERLLSYLSLKDRLQLGAVSRSCHEKVTNSRVKHLCYSELPIGRILGKSRWASEAFAENFINSTRFASFFDTYGQTILSSLKHLRLCDLSLDLWKRTVFIRTLNSFSKLEELVIVRVKCNPQRTFKLNLPALTSIHLEELTGMKKLTLDAPSLRNVKLVNDSPLRLDLVHGESVESFLSSDVRDVTNLRNLKNLTFLYYGRPPVIDSKLLSGLQQLKEFHTVDNRNVSEIFEQKQRYGRADLKIYFCGLLLNGPHDPAINALLSSYHNIEAFGQLAKNPSRLADAIPFYRHIYYSNIAEGVAPGLELDLLKRFTRLNEIRVINPVQDIQRFLNLLKNCKNIVELLFTRDQPQAMFDQLPQHRGVQRLKINHRPSDLAFLFRMKHLIHLNLDWPTDIETVRKVFEELPLSSFKFQRPDIPGYYGQVEIRIVDLNRFRVSGVRTETKSFSELNAAIEYAHGIKRQRKRKADVLE